jgi:hypothetical protein
MLLTGALVLLMAWLLGVVGVYDVGDAIHGLLLVGLMLLLFGLLKSREAALAAHRARGESPGRR